MKFKKLEKKQRYGDKHVITVYIEIRSMFQAPKIVKRDLFVDPDHEYFSCRWIDTGDFISAFEYGSNKEAIVAFAKSSETVLEIN